MITLEKCLSVSYWACRVAALICMVLALSLMLPQASVAANTWAITGSMSTARGGDTAVLLPNGKVLAAGGEIGEQIGTTKAELYDPTTGTWNATGPLNYARYGHKATLLGNGKVLVVGGYNKSTELYDPTTETWTPTGALNNPRGSHTASLLDNGKVLVAGGLVASISNSNLYTNSAEIYDPVTGTWSATDSMSTVRAGHTGTLLRNGKVLVVGGCVGSGVLTSAELYDPGKALPWILLLLLNN